MRSGETKREKGRRRNIEHRVNREKKDRRERRDRKGRGRDKTETIEKR